MDEENMSNSFSALPGVNESSFGQTYMCAGFADELGH